MVQASKEVADIQVDDPIHSPAALSRYRNGVQGRPAGPVSVGVPMEHGFYGRFQRQLYHHLSDPVGHGGNS